MLEAQIAKTGDGTEDLMLMLSIFIINANRYGSIQEEIEIVLAQQWRINVKIGKNVAA